MTELKLIISVLVILLGMYYNREEMKSIWKVMTEVEYIGLDKFQLLLHKRY